MVSRHAIYIGYTLRAQICRAAMVKCTAGAPILILAHTIDANEIPRLKCGQVTAIAASEGAKKGILQIGESCFVDAVPQVGALVVSRIEVTEV